MLDLLYKAKWDQALDFLSSGTPALGVTLFALNSFFLVLFAIRRTRRPRPMTLIGAMQLHTLILLANTLVLFRGDVVRLIAPYVLQVV